MRKALQPSAFDRQSMRGDLRTHGRGPNGSSLATNRQHGIPRRRPAEVPGKCRSCLDSESLDTPSTTVSPCVCTGDRNLSVVCCEDKAGTEPVLDDCDD